MKKILFIAPGSYPIGGAESIVNIKLLKALSHSGQFEIDLVSKRNKSVNYPSPPLETLGIKLNSISIVEVDNKFSFRTLFQHLMCLFYFGVVFKGSHWSVAALPVVKRLVCNNHYDYIITKNSPSLLLGYYLKRRYGIKWVATWNDPYPHFLYPKIYTDFLHAKEDWASRKQLSIMNKYVDVHICPSETLKEHMLNYIHVDSNKFVVIPHVINDVNIFHINDANNKNVLRFIHSGDLCYPRNPRLFLKALHSYLVDNPSAKVEFDILGVCDSELKSYISSLKLEDVCHFHTPVPYDESLVLVSEYDVAVIIEAECPIGVFLPTKVSDFMQVGIPIFAVSPSKGVLNDLYNQKHIPYFAYNKSVEDIKKEISKIYNDFLSNSISHNQIPDSYTERSVVSQYLSL